MIKYIGLRLSAVFVVIFFTISCKKDQSFDGEVKDFNQIIKAVSKSVDLSKIYDISYHVQGASYEWDEPSLNYPNPINTNNFNYLYYGQIDKSKICLQYQTFSINQPISYQTKGFQIVIDELEGVISGEYDFKSYYLKMSYPQNLNASRIASLSKNLEMANPVALIKKAKKNKSLSIINNSFYVSTPIQDLFIEIAVDPVTNLPKFAQVTESDFLKGDVKFRIEYSNWTNINEINYPSKLHYYLDDLLIKSESLSNILFNSNINDQIFELPKVDTPIKYDAPNGWMGYIYSQWYNRWMDKGLLFDQPLNNGAWILEDHDLSSYGLQNQYVSNDIKIVGRPDHSLYSVAIQTKAGVFLFEPTLNTFWTRSVLNIIKSKFIGKPISGTIISHMHGAVASGLREAAYESKNLYIGSGGKVLVDKVLSAHYKLNPDAFSLHSQPVLIREITDKHIISEGELEIYYVGGSGNKGGHSSDMIIAYDPRAKAIIQSELFWSGPFRRVWKGQAANKYSNAARLEFKARANFLKNFITNKQLAVNRIISVQGGVGSYEDLLDIINN